MSSSSCKARVMTSRVLCLSSMITARVTVRMRWRVACLRGIGQSYRLLYRSSGGHWERVRQIQQIFIIIGNCRWFVNTASVVNMCPCPPGRGRGRNILVFSDGYHIIFTSTLYYLCKSEPDGLPICVSNWAHNWQPRKRASKGGGFIGGRRLKRIVRRLKQRDGISA